MALKLGLNCEPVTISPFPSDRSTNSCHIWHRHPADIALLAAALDCACCVHCRCWLLRFCSSGALTSMGTDSSFENELATRGDRCEDRNLGLYIFIQLAPFVFIVII